MPDRPVLSETYVDPHPYPPGVAYADGQYVPVGEAKVSVLDYGFLRSDAVYDVVHVWDGRFFRLDRHIERFFASAAALHLTVPHGPEDVARILHNCVALSGLKRAYVEMLCTRGTSPTFSRDPRQAENRFMAFAVAFGSVAGPEAMERGLTVVVSDRVRIPPASFDPRVKNYQWLDLVCGLYEAYERGGEVPLLRNLDGSLAEGPGFNLFVVKDGALATPAEGVLHGITREAVFDLCAGEGIVAEARAVAVDELVQADEAFVTSTAGGIMPLGVVNDAPIGCTVPGPVTARLTKLYWDRHADPAWSEPVDYPAS